MTQVVDINAVAIWRQNGSAEMSTDRWGQWERLIGNINTLWKRTCDYVVRQPLRCLRGQFSCPRVASVVVSRFGKKACFLRAARWQSLVSTNVRGQNRQKRSPAARKSSV